MENLDTTVPGGLYLSADGKTYHDANGKELTKEEVATLKGGKVEAPESKEEVASREADENAKLKASREEAANKKVADKK